MKRTVLTLSVLLLALTPLAPLQTQAGPVVVTLTPTDDATIRPGSKSSRNYGARPGLLVDLSTQKDFLVRFDVTGVGTRTVTKATLRLFATNGSGSGGDFYLVTDDAWSESTVTWDNAPAADGGLVGSLGAVAAGSWYELDVTSVVIGDGPISLRAASTNADGADYSSKENVSNTPPELVVELVDTPVSDTEPPTAPPNLVARAVLSSSVAMAWDPSTDNVGVVGYEVSRDGALLASVGASTTSFWDQTVTTDTTYSYDVVARDAAGNSSLASTLVVTTVSPLSSVRITAAGDHGGDNNTGGQTLTLIAALDPAAHLALGDMSYSDVTPESAWCDWVTSGDAAGGVAGVGSIPFQVVAGNHEEDTRIDGFIRDFAACLPDRMGSVGDYGVQYYMDVGGLVRVIMIAADLTIDGEYYDYNGGTHRAWLEQAVTDARSFGIPWVVVGMHKLCVTAGTKSCEIGEPMMDWLLAPGRADLVLHGHDHTVQRSRQLSCVDDNAKTPGCIVDSDSSHAKGAGGVILIGGTFGRSPYPIDTSNPEIGYFASWMGDGDTLPDEAQGLWLLDFDASDLSGQWVGSTSGYTDSFSVGPNGPPGRNTPPVAVDDAGPGFVTTSDLDFTTGNVIDNDIDPNDDPLVVTGVDTSATLGMAIDNGDGTFDYTPPPGYSGNDTFSYTVSDPAGGSDTATVTITVTDTAGPDVVTLTPTDDATIRPGSRSSRNYGSAPDLLVDLSSQKDFLLRFDVTGVGTRAVAKATLRLWATDGSSSGGDFYLVTDNAWSESTVTWDNAPGAAGGPVGSLGAVAAGSWYELDVSALVTGDGPISFRAASTNPDGADYASKENIGNPPAQLVIELGE